jgi:hypothetical protein
MIRRLPGLLAALCLATACEDKPVGQMEPIPQQPPRPGAAGPPPGSPLADAAPAAAPEPKPEPKAPEASKVVLRWSLAPDAPAAFRLSNTTTTTPRAPEPEPVKKGKKPPPPPPAPEPRVSRSESIYVLQKTPSGDYTLRIAPQEKGGKPAQGTISERGFVLDGLEGPLRNTAALVLELPMEPMAVGDTWNIGLDLVDLSAYGSSFIEEKAERNNTVKLAALTPGENGEQVATLEYDLRERITGQGRRAARVKGQQTPQSVTTEVRVQGRGEFLLKAGRWRSWEGTLTTSSTGTLPAPKGSKAPALGANDGQSKLTLTPLATVPPELLATPER